MRFSVLAATDEENEIASLRVLRDAIAALAEPSSTIGLTIVTIDCLP
jgi:hypothetical protein